MAAKKSSKKDLSPLVNRGIKESALLGFVAISIFLSLSLYSYSPSDPSWSHSLSAALEKQIVNLGGSIGANIADIIYNLLGYMAYFIPFVILYFGWYLYLFIGHKIQYNNSFYVLRFIGFIITLASSCAIGGLHFNHYTDGLPVGIGFGGILGELLVELFLQNFSLVGSSLLFVTMFIIGFTLFTNLSWLWLMDRTGKLMIKFIHNAYHLTVQVFYKLYQWINNKRFVSVTAENNNSIVESYTSAKEESSLKHTSFKEKLSALSLFKKKDSHAKEGVQESNIEISTVYDSKTDHETDSIEGDFIARVKETFDMKRLFKQNTEDEFKTSPVEDEFYRDKIEPVFGGSVVDDNPDNFNVDSFFAENKKTNTDPVLESRDSHHKQEQSDEELPKEMVDAFVANVNKVDKKTRPVDISIANHDRKPSNRVLKESQKKLFLHDQIDCLPALSLLDKPRPSTQMTTKEELEVLSRRIEEKLADYNLIVDVVAVQQGPVITRFELQLAAGIKVSQLTNLSKDLARALLVISIRVVEVIAGKSTVGIEIPNEYRQIVSFYDVLNSKAYGESKQILPLALGHDISGQPVVADLAKMPHLLVAGTTGSGKSVGINSMILSMLFHANADDLRMIMVDPKMLELSIYEGIPHLLCPVVTDMMEAANALRWCVAEMERRYKLLSALGVRNIAGYNKKIKDAIDAGQPILDPLFEPNPMQASLRPDELETLPYIVIVIDEFADMMMVVGKKVEELIARLAQKARAAGMHLIIATQRPSVNVITGLIKANVPTRIAFQVSSKIDSRTILDQMGAENLLGNGDMLFQPPGTGMPQRVHGAFVSDDEVHAVVNDLKSKGSAEYIEEILSGEGVDPIAGIPGEDTNTSESDPLYDQAVAIVLESRKASISGIQRRLKVGYNRAARMVEDMEAAGVVSKVQSNGQREVLAPEN